ncbi:MAG: bifunctional DNA-formamidopyrimidine glycosylase/DNA-(apurinic or apyrimidinic site) lyase [Terriglobales bacterium]|jgi:formamidopyrimidine-DNA glycosylase
MPELPEVETVVRGLRNSVVGDVIEDIWLSGRRQPLKSSPEEIAAVLTGARIAGVRRMGKHIVIDLVIGRPENREIGRSGDRVIEKRGQGRKLRRISRSSENQISRSPDHPIIRSPDFQFIVHLGMTGRLLIVSPDAPLAKHTHLVARLQSGRELRFVDPRMFGKLAVVREPFETAGTEPLDIGFELFAGLFRKRQTPIKSALLNQKLLRGIGNIYADESLARAGIRPRRRAATLTRADLHHLLQSVQQVLNQAIAAGGSSVSDYVDAAGEPGFFQFQHRVYGREGEPCLSCGTPIKRVVIAGRSSHYCPKCQK